MRRIAIFLALVASLHAAGSMQQSFQQLGTSNNFVLAANWTGDSVTGSVPATLANVNNQVQGYRIFAVEVAPGSPAPTNNYSITLTTPAGVDMLLGTGASLSNTTATQLQTPSFAPPVNGTVTINVTGNSVGGAQGKILIYFAQIAQIHGLIPNGPGFPTNNTFTGTNTFTGVTNTANLNSIRFLDGVKFPRSAAGINAADADIGANSTGEIWVPSTVATDAQISIGAGHTLRVLGILIIDAVNKGPILLGASGTTTGGSKLICASPSPDNNAQIIQSGSASGTLPSMVRLAVQDGSETNIGIEGCWIFAGNNPVTNGVIDATGITQRGWIRDNKLGGFTSGNGIFIQDVQSGALAGTNSLQILNNQIVGTTTGACIAIQHSSTNAVTINGIDIQDLNCGTGATSGNSVFIGNSDPTASHLRQISISKVLFSSTPTGASSILLAGVQGVTVNGIACLSGSSCVTITNSSLNGVISIDNIVNYNGNNTLLDQSAANVTITTPGLDHYDFPINNTAQVSYLNNVSYLKVNGLAPASATGSGFGTGPSFALAPGSTNNAGTINITVGTTPSTSGTVTVNFNTSQSTFGTNQPVCVWTLQNNTAAWSANAVVGPIVTASTSADGVTWNNTVALTASSVYSVNYWCTAK